MKTLKSFVHLEMDDLDNAPFDGKGGVGKMYQVFGEEMYKVVDVMNEVLAAWS